MTESKLITAILSLPMPERMRLARVVCETRRALPKPQKFGERGTMLAAAEVAAQVGQDKLLLHALATRFVMTCPACGAHWKRRRRAGGWRKLDAAGARTAEVVDALPGCCAAMEKRAPREENR